MPEGWVLRKALIRSHRFRALYPDSFTQLVYCLLQAVKDSWGMVPADPDSLKGHIGPFDPVNKPEAFREAVNRLKSVRLVYEWENQGDPWIYMIGHDEKHGHQKRARNPQVPRPDLDEMNAWAKTWSEPGHDQVETRSKPSHDQDRSRFGDAPPARAGSGIRFRFGEGEGNAHARETPPPLESQDVAKATESPPEPEPSGEPPPPEPGSGGRGPDSEPGTIQGGPRTGPAGSSHEPPVSGSRVFVVDNTPGEPGEGAGPPPPAPASSSGDLKPPPAGPGECMVSPPPVSSGRPGGHPSRLAEVLPAIWPDGRPTSEHHLEITELLEAFRAIWILDMPPPMPTHDNRRRIVEGLTHPALGFPRMKDAIRGHYRLATADNDRGRQMGRDFMHVFPPARIGGNPASNRLDIDRVCAFASEVRRRPPGAKRPHRAREEIPRDQAVSAARRGMEAVREALKENP